MKRTFVSSLVVVLLSASFAPIASAQTTETSFASSTEVSASRSDTTPFDLVQAGINSNRLSSDKLNDNSYISSVNTHLNSFIRYDD